MAPRLGPNIPEDAARISSCLDPHTFKKTLNVVRKLLQEVYAETNRKLTYEYFIKEFKLPSGDTLVSSMKEAEAALHATKELSGELASAPNAVTLTVLLWTLNALGVGA